VEGGEEINQRSDKKDSTAKCHHCGKPAIINYGETPLCIDCYHKVAQADFMEQQILHNRLSWNASQLNLVEQELYAGTGGLLPLKQMMIPRPPSAPRYSSQQIKVSESNIGVINTGTLLNLEAGIEVIQNLGDKDLANAVKELTQAVLDSNDINDQLKTEIAEQLEFLVTEALASKDKKRKGLARKVIDNISKSISTVASLLTIWNTLHPLLQAYFGP
jgi:hypothetical protein